MEDLITLFDSLLTLMVSFPVTIFQVLIAPERVVGADPDTLISPPGATLVVSLIIWYLSASMKVKIKYALELPSLPEKDYAMRVFVLVVIVLMVQCLVLLIPSVIPTQPVDAAKIVKALSYPVSVLMTIYGLVYLVYILFPIGSRPHGMTIMERGDPIWREIRQREGASKRIVVEENAEFIAIVAGILVYVYALYNILRGLFQLSIGQAIWPTIVLLFSTIVLMVLFSSTGGRLDGLVDKLRSEKEGLSEKGTG